MARTSTVLVLVVTAMLGLAGCCTPKVNINVDKNAVSDAKEMVSRVTRDVGADPERSRRE